MTISAIDFGRLYRDHLAAALMVCGDRAKRHAWKRADVLGIALLGKHRC
jgi:hypothetical protein